MNTNENDQAGLIAESSAKLKKANDGDPDLIPALMQTKEVRLAVNSALPRILNAWAGGNPIRKMMAGILSKVVLGGFRESNGGGPETSIRDLLREPEHARRIAGQLPALINGALDAAGAVTHGMAQLPAEKKAAFLSEIVAHMDMGKAGALMTGFARFANEAHEADPSSVAEKLRPGFQEWIRNVDFGEMKTAADRLAENTAAFVEMVNGEMWRYPAKMLCLLSMIPPGVNAGMAGLASTLAPMNALPPDLAADVLLSLLREIKSEELGRLANETLELIRKIHAGSILIGEQGKPRLPGELSAKIGEVLRSIDVELLLKALGMLAETGEATETALSDVLEDHPALVREMIAGRFREKASSARRLRRKIDLVERTLTGEQFAAEAVKGIGETDAQELADTLNRLLAMLNRFHDRSPEIIREALSQTIGSLDEEEVGRTARWLAADIAAALAPLAPEILPPVLKGIAELIAPNESGRDGEIREALEILKTATARKEATV